MSELTTAVDTPVRPDYHMFGIADCGSVGETTPTPGDDWLGVGTTGVLLRVGEQLVSPSLRLEVWDGQPPDGLRDHEVQQGIRLLLPTGQLAVNEISGGWADGPGVSIKTLYRHFENKDDLFVAVIQAACAAAAGDEHPAWLDLPLVDALTEAGAEHLAFVLSPDQIALYRVVARDAPRFPQLGTRYREQVMGERTGVFVRHLKHWPADARAKVNDPLSLSRTYFALLHADLLETALLTGTVPAPDELRAHARHAATCLVTLLESAQTL
ncbi:TetR/AcrR family transcriptional regulator [Saccharopolyspora sp. K220]|uniref:TetR/AcrR family transcriptional regulator C-terminal domain-containing protein n=1 Tax=Saccharopolyspora soli TaxID=2926618 RepID=UPI001F58F9E7|nr:TetR/AcrR family transcriptional regulator C-terminal domain-containing protein [Saccharopolyspora soli]MCI2421405.1 TetR/AcrR family transcriptional regulator [Saccharopolyspora soli]